MKFKQQRRYEFEETARKRSFVLIKQRREREKFPLFADEIRETQPSVDEVMDQRREGRARWQADNRAKRARQWVNVRRALKLLPDRERYAFLAYYYRVRFPLDPGYMHSVLHDGLRGQLVMTPDGMESASHLAWLAERDAKIRAMSDAELDKAIQETLFDGWRDTLRAERARRAGL